MHQTDDILNIDRLKEAFGEDRAAIASLLGLARGTELRYITELRQAMAAHDIREVSRAAHSIKGSASNIGANLLSRAAAKIEDVARRESWDGIPEFADELDLRYAELSEHIAKYEASVV